MWLAEGVNVDHRQHESSLPEENNPLVAKSGSANQFIIIQAKEMTCLLWFVLTAEPFHC